MSANCRSCGELALVASAFQRARSEALDAAKVGPPSVLWWRAQLRQRNAAVERIGRPMLGALIFALVVSLALAVGLAAWQVRDGIAWLKQLPQTSMQTFDSGWTQIFSSLWSSALPGSAWNWMVLLSAGATLALLSGVVVYLATEKP